MWVLYALLSAVFVASTDPIAKQALKDGSDEYFIGWIILLLSTPFLAVFYFLNNPVLLNPELIKILFIVLPFEILAAGLYYRALKLTDISLTVPFLALTPVFVVITAFLFLGETIRPAGVIGILLITIGVYSLNIKEAIHGIAHPIIAVLLNKGSVYMVFVALIYSVTASLSKKAMLASSPSSIPFLYNMSISLGMLPLIIYRLKTNRAKVAMRRNNIISYIALGALAALSSIFFFKSLALVNVAYAISIKRLSLLISVGYGWLLFKERDIHIRLISTLCMFFGVVLILAS